MNKKISLYLLFIVSIILSSLYIQTSDNRNQPYSTTGRRNNQLTIPCPKSLENKNNQNDDEDPSDCFPIESDEEQDYGENSINQSYRQQNFAGYANAVAQGNNHKNKNFIEKIKSLPNDHDTIMLVLGSFTPEEINKSFGYNNESIGHVLLRKKAYKAFEEWMRLGGDCKVITARNDKSEHFNDNSVLHSLLIKKTTPDIDLPRLVEMIVDKNPSLLNYYQRGKESPLKLLLHNRSLSDETVLKILQVFNDKGFDFNSDPLLKDSQCFGQLILRIKLIKEHEESVKYLEECLKAHNINIVTRSIEPADVLYAIKELVDTLPEKKGNQELIKKFMSDLDKSSLDLPVFHNESSLGHLFLNENLIVFFRHYLDSGAKCTAISKEDQGDTILSSLCIKGIDQVPDMPELIERILEINPDLLFTHIKNGKYVPSLILTNRNLPDDISKKILEAFTGKGFNFNADPYLLKTMSNYRFCNDLYTRKPLCIEFIKNIIEQNLTKSNQQGLISVDASNDLAYSLPALSSQSVLDNSTGNVELVNNNPALDNKVNNNASKRIVYIESKTTNPTGGVAVHNPYPHLKK